MSMTGHLPCRRQALRLALASVISGVAFAVQPLWPGPAHARAVGAGTVMAITGPLGWWPAASATVTALAAFLLNAVIRICILRGRRK